MLTEYSLNHIDNKKYRNETKRSPNFIIACGNSSSEHAFKPLPPKVPKKHLGTLVKTDEKNGKKMGTGKRLDFTYI
jgi:hypothetical protein